MQVCKFQTLIIPTRNLNWIKWIGWRLQTVGIGHTTNLLRRKCKNTRKYFIFKCFSDYESFRILCKLGLGIICNECILLFFIEVYPRNISLTFEVNDWESLLIDKNQSKIKIYCYYKFILHIARYELQPLQTLLAVKRSFALMQRCIWIKQWR